MRRVRVVCINRDHSLDYIRTFIPSKYWGKVLYVQDDIRQIDIHNLLSKIQAVWRMRCGVGSYTYTYLHHAERAQEPIAVYLDIEIETANH